MTIAIIAPLQRYDSSGWVIVLMRNPVLPVAERKRFQDRILMSRRFLLGRSRRGKGKFLSATGPVCIVVPLTRQAEIDGGFHD